MIIGGAMVRNVLTAILLTMLAASTAWLAVLSAGFMGLAFAITSLTSWVGVLALTLQNWPRVREFHSLLRCFATCLAPLSILFATLDALPGVHQVTSREQTFMFNLCISLPLFAYLRKPNPLETLRYIEMAMMAIVAGICLVSQWRPLENNDSNASQRQYQRQTACRILFATFMWSSPWLVDAILYRMPRVSAVTSLLALLLRGMTKIAACCCFAAPYLRMDVDFTKLVPIFS